MEKEKISIFKRIKNVVEKAKGLDTETLNYMKMGLFGLIVVDLFGLYYYLEWKQLAIAVLIVIMVAVAVVLYLLNSKLGLGFNDIRKTAQNYLEEKINKTQKGGNKNMETEQIEQKQSTAEEEPKKPTETVAEKPKDEDKDEKKDDDLGLGIPSAEEHQKRMDEAFGSV